MTNEFICCEDTTKNFYVMLRGAIHGEKENFTSIHHYRITFKKGQKIVSGEELDVKKISEGAQGEREISQKQQIFFTIINEGLRKVIEIRKIGDEPLQKLAHHFIRTNLWTEQAYLVFSFFLLFFVSLKATVFLLFFQGQLKKKKQVEVEMEEEIEKIF